MNRRNFLSSSALAFGALTIIPSSIIAEETSNTSLHHFGKGFQSIQSFTSTISIDSVSDIFKESFHELSTTLKTQGYDFNASSLIKFNQKCYALPIVKKSLLNVSTKELAFLIKNQNSYNTYILDHQSTIAFDQFIESFYISLRSHNINFIDLLEVIAPYKVTSYKKGKHTLFAFRNKNGDHITIHNTSKGTKTTIS